MSMAQPEASRAARGALKIVDLPLVEATPKSLKDFGCLVDDPDDFDVEIRTWPQPGWRTIDPGTGNEGGTTDGVFEFWWQGEVLYGRNNAVGDQYLLGWSKPPEEASEDAGAAIPDQVLLWHVNYHPDGGQLFFPQDGTPFVTPLALPGDDVKPEDFTVFWFDGTKGLYIHPDIWHEGVFPIARRGSFYDRQGKVHARISCDLAEEFGCYLRVPLRRP